MENPEVRQAVLDGLVMQKLVGIGAERAGIRMGDKQLAEKIYSEPAFQEDGRFNKQRYEAIARSQNMSTVGLDERLRQDYREQQFRGSIVDTTIVPRSTLDSFIRLSQQSREVSVVNLAPEQYAARVKIAPEAVKKYYDEHPVEFTIPEQVRVEYLELSQDAAAARATASADEVKRVYEEEVKAGKHGTREERPREPHPGHPVPGREGRREEGRRGEGQRDRRARAQEPQSRSPTWRRRNRRIRARPHRAATSASSPTTARW
jgi:peptidyl-prolyl cis-trans isomerase D